jgi:hypothetical protein
MSRIPEPIKKLRVNLHYKKRLLLIIQDPRLNFSLSFILLIKICLTTKLILPCLKAVLQNVIFLFCTSCICAGSNLKIENRIE